MPYYLMRFDRSTLEEPTFEEFFDRAEASARHRVAEREAPADVDVVLFGARSLDALRVTHSSYFKGRERRERLASGGRVHEDRRFATEVAEPVDV